MHPRLRSWETAPESQRSVWSFGLALVAHTVASTPSVRGGMILNNNFAEHAAKLLDPNLPVQTKQQLVTEMRDSIEIVHTSEYGNFLTHLFPAFHKMLAQSRPQFAEARGRLRHPPH